MSEKSVFKKKTVSFEDKLKFGAMYEYVWQLSMAKRKAC